eukprot:scaffold1519_cov166-Amphora_coffeaeformis.AAC.1
MEYFEGNVEPAKQATDLELEATWIKLDAQVQLAQIYNAMEANMIEKAKVEQKEAFHQETSEQKEDHQDQILRFEIEKLLEDVRYMDMIARCFLGSMIIIVVGMGMYHHWMKNMEDECSYLKQFAPWDPFASLHPFLSYWLRLDVIQTTGCPTTKLWFSTLFLVFLLFMGRFPWSILKSILCVFFVSFFYFKITTDVTNIAVFGCLCCLILPSGLALICARWKCMQERENSLLVQEVKNAHSRYMQTINQVEHARAGGHCCSRWTRYFQFVSRHVKTHEL